MSQAVELQDKLSGIYINNYFLENDEKAVDEQIPPQKVSKIARLSSKLKERNAIVLVQFIVNILLLIALVALLIYNYNNDKSIPTQNKENIPEEVELKSKQVEPPKPLEEVDYNSEKYFSYKYHNKILLTKEKLLDSNLVPDPEDQLRIIGYLPLFPKEIVKLYSAKENGCTSQKFHEYCDKKGPTLTIIKSNKGYTFGGYTERQWYNFACTWQYYTAKDIHSFVFSVDRKIRDMDGNFTTVEQNPTKGPVFGNMIDIADDACNNENSFTMFNPMYKKIQLQDFKIFEEEHFKVEEIEVFKIVY